MSDGLKQAQNQVRVAQKLVALEICKDEVTPRFLKSMTTANTYLNKALESIREAQMWEPYEEGK